MRGVLCGKESFAKLCATCDACSNSSPIQTTQGLHSTCCSASLLPVRTVRGSAPPSPELAPPLTIASGTILACVSCRPEHARTPDALLPRLSDTCTLISLPYASLKCLVSSRVGVEMSTVLR